MDGACYWLSNRELRWRPEHYWTPGTTVEVAVNTYGVDLGEGLFDQENVATRFTNGDEVIATADDDTKTITVTPQRRDGQDYADLDGQEPHPDEQRAPTSSVTATPS